MRIIPVMDILNGVVVHAVKGKRSRYLPLQSSLCYSAEPVIVASEFRKCGFSELYIADLDAIQGTGSNFRDIHRIAKESRLKLMVDSGVSNLNDIEELLCSGVAKVVIGTETLSRTDFIRQAVKRFGEEKIVVSIDLKAGAVISQSLQLSAMSTEELAQRLEDSGVSELIVLDLTRVGSGEGVDFPLLKKLLSLLKLAVLVGGGVRNVSDLVALRNLGIHGVLVATALHNKSVSLDELQKINMLAPKPQDKN